MASELRRLCEVSVVFSLPELSSSPLFFIEPALPSASGYRVCEYGYLMSASGYLASESPNLRLESSSRVREQRKPSLSTMRLSESSSV